MSPRFVRSGYVAAALASVAAGAVACSSSDSRAIKAVAGDVVAAKPASGTPNTAASATVSAPRADSASRPAASSDATPNELGRIPVFEYHLIGDKNAVYERTREGFRRDLA